MEEIQRQVESNLYKYYLLVMDDLHNGSFETCEWEHSLNDFFQDIYIDYLDNKRPIATIEAPVQHGKSEKLRIFTTWLLGREYNMSFNFYTASDDLRIKTQDFIARVLSSKIYNTFFSNKMIKNIDGTIKLEHNFIDFRLMGEGNTGYPSNISIIDDPYRNSDDANSETMRNKIENRFRGDIMSRRQSKSMVIVLHSRWHKKDLIGTLKEDDYFKNIIKIKKDKAIKDDETALFPSFRDITFLKEQKKILGNYNFNALYQQEPIEAGGNVIKTEWFKSYDILPKLKRYYIVCDTAMKTKENSDYSVFLLVGKDNLSQDANYYFIDMIRGHWDSVELLDNLRNFYEKHKTKYNISCLYIEDKASGIGLIQQIKRLSIPVHPITPTKDKYTRLMDVLPRIASGYVYLPNISNWKIDFINECQDFRADMSHTHDDIVDCCSYALSQEVNKNNNIDWLY